MTDVDPETLDPSDEPREMGPLLRDLARHDAVSGEALDRLRARLAKSLPDVDLAPVEPTTKTSTGATTTPDPKAPAPATSGITTSGKLLLAAYGLAVGAVLGGLTVHVVEGRSSEVASVPTSPPAPSSRLIEEPSARPTEKPRAPTAPSSVAGSSPSASANVTPHPTAEPSAPSTPKANPGTTLNAERLVVDVARSAYARGDRDEALRALARHASTYPDGALAEEREALAIRILVDEGRAPEAKARGLKFRTRYPKSLMLPAVEAALESIP